MSEMLLGHSCTAATCAKFNPVAGLPHSTRLITEITGRGAPPNSPTSVLLQSRNDESRLRTPEATRCPLEHHKILFYPFPRAYTFRDGSGTTFYIIVGCDIYALVSAFLPEQADR